MKGETINQIKANIKKEYNYDMDTSIIVMIKILEKQYRLTNTLLIILIIITLLSTIIFVLSTISIVRL